jgi:hypothetical protein
VEEEERIRKSDRREDFWSGRRGEKDREADIKELGRR